MPPDASLSTRMNADLQESISLRVSRGGGFSSAESAWGRGAEESASMRCLQCERTTTKVEATQKERVEALWVVDYVLITA